MVSESKIRSLLPVFLISFASLFLEILVIRWSASEIRVLAYFKNIVLMAAVVGLGLGCASPVPQLQPDVSSENDDPSSLPKQTRPSILQSDPASVFNICFAILALVIGLAVPLGLTHMNFAVSTLTFEWMNINQLSIVGLALNIVKLTAIYLLVLILFDSIGRLLGREFAGRPPLPAYGANLLASLAGLLVFSVLSFLQMPPPVWILAGLAPMAPFSWRTLKQRAVFGICALISTGVAFWSVQGSTWSPYYRIDHAPAPLAGAPAVTVEVIEVNHAPHQKMIDFSDEALKKHPELKDQIEYFSYNLPYAFNKSPNRVMIVGAGTGNDVAAALRAGAKHVDAIEIDPAIQKLGSKMHRESPYSDPRVHVVINDARAFLESSKDKYDLIVFAYLDSHTAFSVASSVRLDNYLYTKEALQAAQKHLAPGGIGILSFGAGADWIQNRLYQLVRLVSPVPPLFLETKFDHNGVSIFWGEGLEKIRADLIAQNPAMVRNDALLSAPVELTTDDWPFLYQKHRQLPVLYVSVLGLLALLSFALIALRFRLQPKQLVSNLQFLFLGAGFLLLETRAMLAIAVLFGSTWIVNSIVIGIVLFMAFLGNLAVMKIPSLKEVHGYVGIFAGLALIYFLPLSLMSGQDYLVKLLLSIVLLGIPMLSAGIVFSRSLARSEKAEVALGINIVGAILGACLEYLSLLVGSNGLVLFAVLIYALSIVSIKWRKLA